MDGARGGGGVEAMERGTGGGVRARGGMYLGFRSMMVSETRVRCCFLCLRLAKTMSSSQAGAEGCVS